MFHHRGGSALPHLVVIAALLAGTVATSGSTARAVSTQQGTGTFEFLPDGGVGEGVEVVAERTEFSQTFATGIPGVFRTVQSPTPVHYQDETGAWQPIDTELTTTGDGLTPEATGPQIEIAPTAAEPELASIETPQGGSVAFGLADAAAVPATVDGATASFEDVAPDTSIELTALASGVKEVIVLDGAGSPTHFEFPLQLDGVTPTLEADGSVVYRNAATDIVARTPAGFMTDSTDGRGEGTRSDGVVYGLTETGEGWTLTVDLDAAWLADPARVYPVVVDPTTYTEPLSTLSPDLDDTYLVQGAAATDRSSESVLKIGYDGTAVHRAFLHFSELDLFEGMNILQARLDLTQTGASACTGSTPFEAYRATTDWTGSTATAYPGPSVSAVAVDRLATANTTVGYGGGSGCASSGMASIMVTPAAWRWTEGGWYNQGIFLRAADETSIGGFRQFASADDPSHPPSLEVIWSDPTAGGTDSPARPTSQAPAGLTASTLPTLSATFDDPQDEDGHVGYFVYNPENYYWGWATGDVVESGEASTFQVPSTGALPLDTPLVVRAVAVEGTVATSGPPHPHSTLSPAGRLEVPSTAITSPSDGAEVSGTLTVSATAAATVDGLAIDGVDFVVDGTVIATDTTSPYGSSVPSSDLGNGEHLVEARSAYGSGTVSVTSPEVWVTVDNSPCPADDGAEPNDSRSQATTLTESTTGAVCGSNTDWFAVDLEADETIEATLTPDHAPGDLDLVLLSSTSTLATSATTSGTETVSYQVTTAGTYYLKVYGHTSTDEDGYLLQTTSDAPETESTPAAAAPETLTFGNQLGLGSLLHYYGDPNGSDPDAEEDIGAELAQMADIGITRIREDFEQNLIQTGGGGRSWHRWDRLMAAAAANDIDVLAILKSTDIPTDTADITRFATFAGEVVSRYKVGGYFWTNVRTEFDDSYGLRSVEIWNEPFNLPGWGQTCPNPGLYADLVIAADDAVDREDPAVRVAISGDLLQQTGNSCGANSNSGQFLQWLSPVLANTPIRDHFDVLSVHPYMDPRNQAPGDTAGDSRFDLRRFNEILDRQVAGNVRRKPIWITEMGWATTCTAPQISNTEQAAWTSQAIKRTLGSEWPTINRYYVFTWSPQSTSCSDAEGRFGIRYAGGGYKEVARRICIRALGRSSCPLT